MTIIFLSETWRDRVDSELLEWDDDFQEFPKTAHRDFKKRKIIWRDKFIYQENTTSSL